MGAHGLRRCKVRPADVARARARTPRRTRASVRSQSVFRKARARASLAQAATRRAGVRSQSVFCVGVGVGAAYSQSRAVPMLVSGASPMAPWHALGSER